MSGSRGSDRSNGGRRSGRSSVGAGCAQRSDGAVELVERHETCSRGGLSAFLKIEKLCILLSTCPCLTSCYMLHVALRLQFDSMLVKHVPCLFRTMVYTAVPVCTAVNLV